VLVRQVAKVDAGQRRRVQELLLRPEVSLKVGRLEGRVVEEGLVATKALERAGRDGGGIRRRLGHGHGLRSLGARRLGHGYGSGARGGGGTYHRNAAGEVAEALSAFRTEG